MPRLLEAWSDTMVPRPACASDARRPTVKRSAHGAGANPEIAREMVLVGARCPPANRHLTLCRRQGPIADGADGSKEGSVRGEPRFCHTPLLAMVCQPAPSMFITLARTHWNSATLE
jgi:hypothetical protein